MKYTEKLHNKLVEHGLNKIECLMVGAVLLGKSHKEVAACLRVPLYSVKHYLTHVYRKLNVDNKFHMVLRCVGFVDA